MNQDDLKQVREHWYAAYFAGDITRLSQLQAQNFTVISERGVQSKKSQIDGIAKAKQNGSWFPQGGKRHDTELTIKEVGDSATVTGKGYIIAGQSKEPLVVFAETWKWDGAAWRVASLTYRFA